MKITKLLILAALMLVSLTAISTAFASPARTVCALPDASCHLALNPEQLNLKTGDKYNNESGRAELRSIMAAKDKLRGVIYLTPEQREERRIVIVAGIVYDHKGNRVPDTKNGHHDIANYVMDLSGNFYLFDEYTTPLIRHSSILAGAPVGGAGNIQIKDGKIVYLDSDSGHYPTKPLFPQVLSELKSSGVDVSGFRP